MLCSLRKRISSSHHFLSADTELRLLELLVDTADPGQVAACCAAQLASPGPSGDWAGQDWEARRDNRDLDTMVSWEPRQPGRDLAIRRETFRAELLYSRTRQLLLTSLTGAVSRAEAATADLDPAPELVELEQHWAFCCKEGTNCDRALGEFGPVPPQAPAYPDLVLYRESGQVETLVGLARLATDLLAGESGQWAGLVAGLGRGLGRLAEVVTGLESGPRQSGSILQLTVWLAETLGHCAILCGAIRATLRGPNTVLASKGKKSKKLKNSVLPKFSSAVEPFNSLLDDILQKSLHLGDLITVSH